MGEYCAHVDCLSDSLGAAAAYPNYPLILGSLDPPIFISLPDIADKDRREIERV